MIYFIHKPVESAVKVGYSADPMDRLGELQVASPSVLEMRGIIPGDKSTEDRMHELFDPWHIRGEWFVARPVLTYFDERLFEHSIACLIEINERGQERRYYKPLRELTAEEAAKHLDSLQAGINKDAHRLRQWEAFHFGIHGEARIRQLRIEFPDDGDD